MIEITAINKRFFSLVLLVTVLGPTLAVLAGEINSVAFALTMSMSSLITYIICMIFGRHNKFGLYVRFLLIFTLAVAMPSFFAAIGPVVKANRLPLKDEGLLQIDTLLLGSFFQDGQLALYIDTHEVLGPETFVGKLFTEVLLICYISYYIWGYGLLVLLSFQYFQLRREGITDKERLSWIQIKMFMCAWLGTYIFNFLINLMVPAVSPRLYIADKYIHDLEGFGLAKVLRDLVYSGAAGSYGTFPSGHTALSWLTAIMASYTFPWYSKFTGVLAVFITLATVYLRFHYVVDIICAAPLILFGLMYGGFLPVSVHEKLTTNVSFRYSKRRGV